MPEEDKIETIRQYFLSRIDTLQTMIADGVKRDELVREIDHIKVDMRLQVEDMKNSLSGLSTQLNQIKDTILDKQKQSYTRIIALQSTLLLPVIIAVIVYIIQTFLKH